MSRLLVLFLCLCCSAASDGRDQAEVPHSPQPTEVYLGLRDFVFCNSPFKHLVDAPRPGGAEPERLRDNPALQAAYKAMRTGNYRAAQAALEHPTAAAAVAADLDCLLALAYVRHKTGNSAGAREAARRLLRIPGGEARTQLLAWAALRYLAEWPPQDQMNRALGIVAEIGTPNGWATIAGYADGDARLITSTGGGLLGEMNQYPTVSRAARQFVAAGQRTLPFLSYKAGRPELPATGRITFAVLTPGGMHVAEAGEPALRNPSHPLHPVFMAMHSLITPLGRLWDERRHGQEPPSGRTKSPAPGWPSIVLFTMACLITTAALALLLSRPNEKRLPMPAVPPAYAAFWRRLLAWCIDTAIIFFIGFAVVFVPILWVVRSVPPGLPPGEVWPHLAPVMKLFVILLYFICALGVPWLYYAAFDSSARQATVGKLALGIFVGDAEMRRLGFGRASGRFLAKIISNLTLGVGYLVAAFSNRKQALHDMIAGCLVLRRAGPATGQAQSDAELRADPARAGGT